MEQPVNQVTLRGTLYRKPEYSHENHGKKFYRFLLEVPRLSGTSDILPVIAEQCLLDDTDVTIGSMLSVYGQMRSHNLRDIGKRHLLIFVFATSITCEDGDAQNSVCLEGIVCRTPIFRMTPLGREICDVMLAVPRAFQRSDYLPCILWGRTARLAAQYGTGDRVQLQGRFQSRNYFKTCETGIQQRTAYEISALSALWNANEQPSNG